MRPEPGSVVGHYRLERRLGAGGMGEVFLARDTRLKRQVAIKFLTGATDETARRRILREARAIAALDHPGICAVHDVSTDSACGDFIVMQYLEGETLAARLARGRLPRDEALTLCAELAAALDAAHQSGVIHRDLKPQNVVLTADGRPRLLDFGIAQRTPFGRGNETTGTASTDYQGFAGTPAYMAPEQVDGRNLDARADLFGLGCVLYECLTGRPAFDGPTSVAVLHQVLTADPPAPSSVQPDLTADDDALCARLLQKKAGERMQTATEARTALLASAAGRPLPAWVEVKAPRGLLSRRAALAAAVALFVAVAGAAWYWLAWRGTRLPTPPPAAAALYDRGVEAMRQGSYATAKGLFEAAIERFPAFVLAHGRLAEALTELDDLESASSALLRMDSLIPDGARLRGDEALRFNAVRSAALRDHEDAIQAYSALATLHPTKPDAWLDLGRANDSASKRLDAKAAYQRALSLDDAYAPAWLRLGSLQRHESDFASSLASLGRAEELYRTLGTAESLGEVAYQKALTLTQMGQLDDADRAIAAGAGLIDPAHAHLKLRLTFQQARIAVYRGDARRASDIAEAGVKDAERLGLDTVAAEGFIEAGIAAHDRGQREEARRHFERAEELAKGRRARRTANRARLQLAGAVGATDALPLALTALEFFKSERYDRNAAEAALSASRAKESLGALDEAARLLAEAQQLSGSTDDPETRSNILDGRASLETRRGNLPQALTIREELEALHRERQDHRWLPFDLTNRAELLARLGRAGDATSALDELQKAIEADPARYGGRQSRLFMLRALVATTQAQWADAVRWAERAGTKGTDSTSLLARALSEHGLAQLGRTGQEPALISAWPSLTTSPALSAELAYWAGATLAARRQWRPAYDTASKALVALDAVTQVSPEIAWRLAAVAATTARHVEAPAPADTTLRDRAVRTLTQISGNWSSAGRAYIARADLMPWVAETRKSQE